MAVAFVSASAEQNFNGAGATPTAFAAGSVSGSNTIGILAVAWADLDGTTVAATWNGSAMTLLDTVVGGFGSSVEGSVALLYILIPTAGNIAITFGSAGNFGGAVALVYSGVNQADPFGTPASATAGSSIADTLTITDGTTGDMVISCIGVDSGASGLTAGDTARLNQSGGGYLAGASDAAGGASVAMDWSWTASTVFAHLAVNINASTGGGASVGAGVLKGRLSMPGPVR